MSKNIIAQAPLRISIAGGGSDLECFYENNGPGRVLNFAIKKYVRTYLSSRDKIIHTRTPIVEKILSDYQIQESFDLENAADIEPNSGLGTSSAYIVSLLMALKKFKNDKIDKHLLIEEAFQYESLMHSFKICGKQDICAAIFGGIGYYEFETQKVKYVNLTTNDSKYFFENYFSLLKLPLTRADDNPLNLNPEILSQISCLALRAREALFNSDYHMITNIINEGWELKKKTNQFPMPIELQSILEQFDINEILSYRTLGSGFTGHLLTQHSARHQANYVMPLPIIPIQIEDRGAYAYEY
jgi:D-glycero-alpha-D-manno-heptose-7-phosphate kinase